MFRLLIWTETNMFKLDKSLFLWLLSEMSRLILPFLVLQNLQRCSDASTLMTVINTWYSESIYRFTLRIGSVLKVKQCFIQYSMHHIDRSVKLDRLKLFVAYKRTLDNNSVKPQIVFHKCVQLLLARWQLFKTIGWYMRPCKLVYRRTKCLGNEWSREEQKKSVEH